MQRLAARYARRSGIVAAGAVLLIEGCPIRGGSLCGNQYRGAEQRHAFEHAPLLRRFLYGVSAEPLGQGREHSSFRV